MISDDVAGLFEQPAGPVLRFRQGTVVAWNADTGANTIDVGGGTLTDLPILNTGEAIALRPGHVVGLLVLGQQMFILGRITPPNDPNFASASLAFDTASAVAQNFAVPVGPNWTSVATATLDVPPWADEALVTVSAAVTLWNPRTVDDFAYTSAYIGETTSGAVGGGFDDAAQIGNFNPMTHVHATTVSNPGATISVSARVQTTGASWAADPLNRAFVVATAVYRSTV